MQKKQQLLLGLIQYLADKKGCSKLQLMKLMFLITQEKPPKFSPYHFHPYKYGPFSYTLYSDLNYLEKKGFLANEGQEAKSIPTITQQGELEASLSHDYKSFIENYLQNFENVEKLIDEIYQKYPIFTCKSERRNIPVKTQLPTKPGIFLIGYEGRDIDQFLFELVTSNINLLVDVRNNPRSMKYMFNQERLKKSLKNVSIAYEHIPELGIPKEFRQKLEMREDYDRLYDQYRMILPTKEEYIQKLIKMGKNGRIALMCFEQDQRFCHRGEIGEYIRQKGIEVTPL